MSSENKSNNPAALPAMETVAVATPMQMLPPISKKIKCNWAFLLLPGETNVYQCILCKGILRNTCNGYGNLMGHFKVKMCLTADIVPAAHPDYNTNLQPVWQAYKEHTKRHFFSSMFCPRISTWAKTVHGWIELVILANNAVQICVDPVYRRNISMQDMARKTL